MKMEANIQMKDRIISKIRLLEDKKIKVSKEIKVLRLQLSELNSPVKVGDKIEYRYGKQIKQAIVEGFATPSYGFKSYVLVCRRILKDGSLGETFTVDHYQYVKFNEEEK